MTIACLVAHCGPETKGVEMAYEKPTVVDFGSIAESTFTLKLLLGKSSRLCGKVDFALGDVCTTP
jgi:hypothetical protein